MAVDQWSTTGARVDEHTPDALPDEWYHVLDLPSGRTQGLFDMAPVLADVPFPDVAGKRCLDVATFDGFWAFEMERRGAAEVVAIDLPNFRHVDWLPRRRHKATDERTGTGFRHAAAALGSRVRRVERNVYDLHPDELGTFDVVMVGALLLHLRSPFAALEAVRSVCAGRMVSVEQCDPVSSLLFPRPVLSVRGSLDWTWTVPNLAGHRRMLEVAGFDVLHTGRSLAPYGPAAPAGAVRNAARLRHRLARRLLGVSTAPGLFTSIAVARPATDAVADDARRERASQDRRWTDDRPLSRDLGPLLARLPWPATTPGSAVDLATPDGVVAFELEHRGTPQVGCVAAADDAAAAQRFATAHDLLDSQVRRLAPDDPSGPWDLAVIADPVDDPQVLAAPAVQVAAQVLSVQAGSRLADHRAVLEDAGWRVETDVELDAGMRPGPATAVLARRVVAPD